MLSVSSTALAHEAAAEPELVESGYATGIFYAFYFGERDIDYIPVAYQKYSDGSYVFPRFVNDAADLNVSLGELDEYNCNSLLIDDCEGVGAHEVFTYEGYEYCPFDVYRFVEPVAIGPDLIDFIFLDGTSYYDPARNNIVLDYVSAIDEEEYMFIVDFALPFDVEDDSTGLTAVGAERSQQIYDVFGRRTNKLQTGFNIVNGAKHTIISK